MVGPNGEHSVRVFCRCLRRHRSHRSQYSSQCKPLQAYSDMYFVGLFACQCGLCRHRCLHFNKFPISFFGQIVLTFKFLYVAKGVAGSKDVFAELFERIGYFLTRLETYTKLTPAAAMTDIIIAILAEVLMIFVVATKELRWGSTSEFPFRRL